jgi:uncharacterized protein (DUF2336 family)
MPTLVANLAAEQAVRPEVLTLADLPGDWLHEQLAELLQRAQREPHRIIVGPRLRGIEVGIDAYTDDDGLILALRYDPLFFRYGARITGGWDEPSAFIPLNEDQTALDLANLGAIIGLLVERANALLPVLRASAALCDH